MRYGLAGVFVDPITFQKISIKKAIENCSWEWASLPPGRYGQPIETMEQALKNYEKFLREETDGVSDLHLIPGFLREFGYQ